MPRNLAGIQKFFPQFLKKLKIIANESPEINKIWQSFLHWYVETKYPFAITQPFITDEQYDGKIDAVVPLPDGKFVVIQSKYNDGYAKRPPQIGRIPESEYEKFDNIVIPAFKTKKTFDDYITSQKIPADKARIYTQVFDAYQKDKSNVKFEFITTYDPPTEIETRFTFFDTANFRDMNYITSLFNLQQERQSPPAEDLIIKFNPQQKFSYVDQEFKVTSMIIRTKVKNFVDYLKARPNDVSIISKNVRVALAKSPINKDLLETFENDPEEFWYSHNGITLICDKITTLEEGKIRIEGPNVINGGQTILTLRETKKNNDKATFLVKIIELERSEKTKDLINNIIIRTNKQNTIYWRDLRANESVMYDIQDYFRDRKIFFERRRGEQNLFRAKIKNQKSIVARPYDMSQIIQVCNNGADGVIDSKRSKEFAFENYNKFKQIFITTNISDSLFQFVLKRLIIDPIFSKIIQPGKGYVRMTTLGIFWEAIDTVNATTYKKWRQKVNQDITLFSFKHHPIELKQLMRCTRDLIKKYKKIRKDMGWNDLDVFIDNSQGITANSTAFSQSKTIQRKIQKILLDYFEKYDNCPNCNKLTDFYFEDCRHCDHKLEE